ncbi:MAG: hypothetical protein K8L99_24335 [Anaerolineae bacterium]|nr:hypothetical protein [Anaerolineae bacterium]
MSVTKTQTTNLKTRLHILYVGAFLGVAAGAGVGHQYNLSVAVPSVGHPLYIEHLAWRSARLTGIQQFREFTNQPAALALAYRQADLPRAVAEVVIPAADRVLLWGPLLGALAGAALVAGLGLLLSERKSHA